MKTATPRNGADVPDAFALRMAVRIDPDANTGLYGLCRSRDGYFTRSEARGFHRIACLLDRPNVMSTCTVRRALVISSSTNVPGARPSASCRSTRTNC